jgi:hypothetical protein
VNLAERLAATSSGASGPVCRVCALLRDLQEPDRSTLRDALAGDVFTSVQISQALIAEGHDVPKATVSRHRRGECRGIG